jgi:hypothetical protein
MKFLEAQRKVMRKFNQLLLGGNPYEKEEICKDGIHCPTRTSASSALADTQTALYHALVGRWYYSMLIPHVPSTAFAISGDGLYATPYPINRTATYDRIGIQVSTLEAGKNIRFGIYEDDGAGYPGDLVIDAGVASLGATGLISVALTPNQQLTKGTLYWLACVTDATGVAQVRTLATTYIINCFGDPAALDSNLESDVSVACPYGVLPDPFPAGGTYAGNRMFSTGLRLASVP